MKIYKYLIIPILLLSTFLTSPTKELTTIIDTPIIQNETNYIEELQQEYNNENVVAYLEIENLDIQTPVLQTTDNEYYLKHNIQNKKSLTGAIFVDYRNTDLSNEKQIIIYGHNTQIKKYIKDLPFYNLNKLTNKTTFNNVSNIKLSLSNTTLNYQILAIKIITTDNEYTRVRYENEDILEYHYKNLLENTLYCQEDCHLDLTDDILILQTCYYTPADSYLLIIAKKIN